MNFTKLFSSVLFVTALLLSTHTQNTPPQYSFKDGEVMDLLLLTWQDNADSLFAEYRKKALPIAAEMSYQNLGVHGITETVQGNIQPGIMLLGKWDNKKVREEFLVEIEKRLPDFHERRRSIWSYFGLTYFEMPKAVSFAIDKSKYNVLTAYWKEDSRQFNSFIGQFKKLTQKHKGKVLVNSTTGKSPFGYTYQPDYFEITSWENKAAFEAFYQQNLKMDTKGLKQVNQFVLN